MSALREAMIAGEQFYIATFEGGKGTERQALFITGLQDFGTSEQGMRLKAPSRAIIGPSDSARFRRMSIFRYP